VSDLRRFAVCHNHTVAVSEKAATSPADEISARLPVTDRRGWALLAATALLVLAGLLWAVFGSAPETVSGAGMIVPASGFSDEGTSVIGSVTQILVRPGDLVEQGQPIATVGVKDGTTEQVRASVDGIVASVVARQGGTTQPGTPLLIIDPATPDIAIGFLPAVQGGKVRVGMPALVAVSSFPEAQYGYISGTVQDVGRLPATIERIKLLVGGNDQLPELVTADGPVLEVAVALDADAETPSGYVWTIGQGPDAEVPTGKLVSVSVVLSDRSPLEQMTE
jgi:multidrug efflux pump subunit AcrA (membrane-fusion protein)